jgi:hypothetical protein
MRAAVPFADPLIERPAPADRAREGIESYLEADRIGHDPGEGDRCLLASADQLLNRQHRTNPPIGGGDPIRRLLRGLLRGRRRLQIIKEPHTASVALRSAPRRQAPVRRRFRSRPGCEHPVPGVPGFRSGRARVVMPSELRAFAIVDESGPESIVARDARGSSKSAVGVSWSRASTVSGRAAPRSGKRACRRAARAQCRWSSNPGVSRSTSETVATELSSRRPAPPPPRAGITWGAIVRAGQDWRRLRAGRLHGPTRCPRPAQPAHPERRRALRSRAPACRPHSPAAARQRLAACARRGMIGG